MGNGCNLQTEGYATRWHVRKHIQTTNSQKDLHPFCSFICWIFLFQASAWLWPNVLYIFLIWRHKHFIWHFKENVTVLLQEVEERENAISLTVHANIVPTLESKRDVSLYWIMLSFSPTPPFPTILVPQPPPSPALTHRLEAHSQAMALGHPNS